MISAEVTYGDAGAATDSFSAIARSVMISARVLTDLIKKEIIVSVL